MELSIQVNKLGPIQNTEIEIAIPSLTVFYGSNISGKSLLGIATVTLLQAYSMVFGYGRLGRLLGSTNPLDLVSTILGDDLLDIRESIRIEKGKVVEEDLHIVLAPIYFLSTCLNTVVFTSDKELEARLRIVKERLSEANPNHEIEVLYLKPKIGV